MSGLHTAPIEWVTVSVAIVWCTVSLYTLRDAVEDQAFLTMSGVNGARKIVADGSVRQEIGRLLKASTMFLASFASLFLEPPPPDYAILPQSLLIMLALVLIGVIGVFSSLLEKRERYRLARMANEVHPKDPVTGQAVERKGPNAIGTGRRLGDMERE